MDWLLKPIEKIAALPPRQELDRFLGPRKSRYLAYASDPKVRAGAASGGSISGLLIHLLERGHIDGAVVSRLYVNNGVIGAKPFIAAHRDEILSAQSSIYMEFPWLRLARKLLGQSRPERRLAVVGLPCHLSALSHLAAQDQKISRVLALKVGVVCSRTSFKELLLKILGKNDIQEGDIESMHFRVGTGRGRMRVTLNEDGEVTFPLAQFKLYRNLHFYSPYRCLLCMDPLAESADVVCGDAWLHSLIGADIQSNMVICRTEKGEEVIREMIEAGDLTAQPMDDRLIYDAQRRILNPAKRTARIKQKQAVRPPGERPEAAGFKTRLHDRLTVRMMFFNHNWSHHPQRSAWIFKVPRPILQMYLAVMSLLKHF